MSSIGPGLIMSWGTVESLTSERCGSAKSMCTLGATVRLLSVSLTLYCAYLRHPPLQDLGFCNWTRPNPRSELFLRSGAFSFSGRSPRRLHMR